MSAEVSKSLFIVFVSFDFASTPLSVSGRFKIILWSAVYGFISAQNLGAAARFKLQVLPVLLVILLFISNPFVEKK